jgi:hypothetical protein
MIDPFESTENRKFYKVSYINLTSHITNLAGSKNSNSEIPYAYNGNFKI